MAIASLRIHADLCQRALNVLADLRTSTTDRRVRKVVLYLRQNVETFCSSITGNLSTLKALLPMQISVDAIYVQ